MRYKKSAIYLYKLDTRLRQRLLFSRKKYFPHSYTPQRLSESSQKERLQERGKG